MIKILGIAMLTIASGVLYRLGGWGDPGRKQFPHLPEWLFNTKARDIGCALCGWLGMIILFDSPWWTHFISMGLLFAALTTYWDWLFGWDNHWMHGFACGIAYFPYAIVCGSWWGWGLRCLAVAMLMGGISVSSKNDIVEEVGRGSVIPLTLPLLFI